MDYYNLGAYRRPVSTANRDAQAWFDRGLIWTYGYNHEKAVACFETALAHDPTCAMAHWGIAYAAGPNYNFEWWKMDPTTKADALARAYDSTKAALALVGAVTPVERALIEALPARYPQRDPIDDQRPWNDDFAAAMKTAHAAHPDDLDLTAIYAESILNQTPWRMWDIRHNTVADGADSLAAQAVLERALETPTGRDHPGILHLYVHLMEMSPTPEKALGAGDRLRELVPDAGHLIHMPTHIDIQCGHYHDALFWNLKGIEADLKFANRNGRINFYTSYRIHAYHFAVYSAMFLGQYAPAMTAAEDMMSEIPERLLRKTSPPMADMLEGYFSIKTHVQIRFGRWHDIVSAPLREDQALYCHTTASQHYAKAVAHAALGDVPAAESARQDFLKARAHVPDSRRIHNNRCVDLLDIAAEMLDGELEYRKGNHDVAFTHLQKAIALEDGLNYDEPWGWMQPVRHALGALALEQDRLDLAEQAYREDLGLAGELPRACIHPDNVWSLTGLDACLRQRGAGDTAEATLIRQQRELAAARTDQPVGASCFCAQSATKAEHP
ncbi:MAG: tetratricopeptide repeat protein [Pseudomonadota bacterium]